MEDDIYEVIEELWNLSDKQYHNIPKKNRKSIKKKHTPERRKTHCSKVCTISQEIINGLGMEDSIRKELIIASELHDVKKYEKKHAKTGADFIKNNIKQPKSSTLNIDNIYNIVRYHSTPKKNKKDKLEKHKKRITSDIKKAIFIIRVSDELSKIYCGDTTDIIDVVEKVHERSIENIINKEEKEKIEDILIEYYENLKVKNMQRLTDLLNSIDIY